MERPKGRAVLLWLTGKPFDSGDHPLLGASWPRPNFQDLQVAAAMQGVGRRY
jgi:hypothetical protein